nr:putative integron gene cassette protein [uncultured bacterium]
MASQGNPPRRDWAESVRYGVVQNLWRAAAEPWGSSGGRKVPLPLRFSRTDARRGSRGVPTALGPKWAGTALFAVSLARETSVH